MNPQVKTVLLTIMTLSVLAIALIEMTGISKTALFNKYEIGSPHSHNKENRSNIASELPPTEIEFEDKYHDFGNVKEGEKVSHTFRFTNVGENPLVISEAIPTCGCTIPSFSKHPILPGEQGEVEIEFNSSNRKGNNNRSIMIVSNAKEQRIPLSFSAYVE